MGMSWFWRPCAQMLSPRNEWMQYTLAFLLGCIIKVIYIYRRVGIEHVAVLAILCAYGFTIINFSAQNTNYLQVSSCHPIKRNDNNPREITLNVTGTSGHNCSRSADLSWVAHSFKHPANHSSTQRSKRHRGSPALRVLQALRSWRELPGLVRLGRQIQCLLDYSKPQKDQRKLQ